MDKPEQKAIPRNLIDRVIDSKTSPADRAAKIGAGLRYLDLFILRTKFLTPEKLAQASEQIGNVLTPEEIKAIEEKFNPPKLSK